MGSQLGVGLFCASSRAARSEIVGNESHRRHLHTRRRYGEKSATSLEPYARARAVSATQRSRTIEFVSNDGGGVLFFRREDRDWRIVARDGWIY